MSRFVCKPFNGFHRYEVVVPGSKSMTNRALLMGALAEGKTILRGVLFSEDSRVFMQALQEIGFQVRIQETEKVVTIEGFGGRLPMEGSCAGEPGETEGHESGPRKVYVGSAGTAARFLTAFLALSGQEFVVEASEQMKKRPMEPLLRALEMLGARFEYLEKPYSFPFRICGREEKNPDCVELNIDARDRKSVV